MNTLILSPHMDDEVLGCASFLEPGAVVLYTTDTHPLYPGIVRQENRCLVAKTGINPEWIAINDINHLDTVPQWDLITEFERLLAAHRPDTVLVPAPSYNQDHRACYEAMLTACRPHDRNWVPKRVLVYEEPETLGAMRRDLNFRPTYFRPVDIERKCALYSVYASQVRGHRTIDQVRGLAALRGIQASVPYAEAFEVARWVD